MKQRDQCGRMPSATCAQPPIYLPFHIIFCMYLKISFADRRINVILITHSPSLQSVVNAVICLYSFPVWSGNYTPAPLKVEWGFTGFTPMFVRPSVRPSVCRKGFRNFLKKTIGSIHFIPGIYPYGVSFLTPMHFHVPSLIFYPLVAKYLAENGVSGTF